LSDVAGLITSISAVAGLGFGVASVFKFKQHKDNPQQVPLGMPLSLLGIGVMLMWMPFLLQSLGTTIAGSSSKKDQAKIGDAPSWLQGGSQSGGSK